MLQVRSLKIVLEHLILPTIVVPLCTLSTSHQGASAHAIIDPSNEPAQHFAWNYLSDSRA
jgi:hypothetical protein